MSFELTSKGTDVFVYVGNKDLGVRLEARGSNAADYKGKAPDPLTPNPIEHAFREIKRTDIGLGEATGRIALHAYRDNWGPKRETVPLHARFAEVDPLTGNLGKNDVGNFLDAFLENGLKGDAHISWGFYDGTVGENHQMWFYVNDREEQWMKRLFEAEPALLKQPLSILALPGSHDAGMYTGLNSDVEARELVDGLIDRFASKEALAGALAGSAVLAAPIFAALAGVLIALKTTSAARRTLMNLAYTQKESVHNQLRLGSRFFDFRPGYNVSFFRRDQQLRHQHGFIPGYELRQFLDTIAHWLNENEKEIVVVNFKYSGFLDSDMKPANAEVEALLDEHLARWGVKKGGEADLGTPIGELLDQNKRVIVLFGTQNIASSYSDDAYATDDPANIVGALEKCIGEVKADDRVAVLELQGTRTNTGAGIARAALTTSDASNPLLSTKGRFDRVTYPFVVQNAPRVPRSALVVLLNDFVDCAMRDYAAAITRRRLRDQG